MGRFQSTSVKYNVVSSFNNRADSGTVQVRKTTYARLVKNLYSSFAPNTFEAILRTTMDGRVLFCNVFFARHFGFKSARSAKGFVVADLFFDTADFDHIKNVLSSQRSIYWEKKVLRTKCGKQLVGLINSNVSRDVDDQPVINWTILDISKGVEFEEGLKVKNEELRKVNATMEKFLYSTSHDLRSPVSSILGLVNLLKMEAKDEALNDYITKIETSALKLDVIIHDLMGYAKTSYQRPIYSRINIRTIVDSIIARYKDEPNARHITFEIVINETIPFYADHEKIEIVFDNLVRNAIHFFDRNKSKSVVKIAANVTAFEVNVEILDNGIGIGKAHHDLIFNMFYKASSCSRGAGLGLFLVKETIQQLKGNISVESEIGFGSVFRIQIPNHKKAKLINRKLQSSATGESNERIN